MSFKFGFKYQAERILPAYERVLYTGTDWISNTRDIRTPPHNHKENKNITNNHWSNQEPINLYDPNITTIMLRSQLSRNTTAKNTTNAKR